MSTSTLQRVRSLLLSKNSAEEVEVEPEVGFKIIYCGDGKELVVKVIGARNLPSSYGNVKPQGYLVKVKVFPGKEKYETDIFKDTWPCINQEFKFPITSTNRRDPFAGKFVMLTVYAVLEQQDNKPKLKARASFKEHVQAFIGGKDAQSRQLVRRNSSRLSFNNRRTIGTVTYNLESGNFTQSLANRSKASLDVWRSLQNIANGVKKESRESKKGTVEVTILYSKSEDGKNDMIQVSLSKLRCSMQTMQDHEKLGGSLYIKMVALEYDVEVAKWKSGSFQPTISMKIDPKTATMQAYINNYNLSKVIIIIKIKCRSMTKKTLLGEITIGASSPIWNQVVNAPDIPVSTMIDFD